MSESFIGRVPVYDRSLELFAYELRPCSMDFGDQGNRQALLKKTWEGIRLEQITGGKQGLLTLPVALLETVSELPWPKNQLILNLSAKDLEGISPELPGELARQGHILAIAGNHYNAQLAASLGFAKIWSLNAEEDFQGLIPFFPQIHQQGLNLLARNIETRQQYDELLEAGCDYFQGRFFERPRLIHGTQIPANRLATLQLIARIEDPEVSIEEIESLVSQDITLSYKLLRLINAAFFGLPSKVDSIRRAVVFLGLQRVKHWATVLLVNAIEYKPRELLITAVVRARTCEQLAKQLKRTDGEQCYIAGLFSVLDAIMDAPMEEILKHLKLIREIHDALLYGAGPIGEILHSAIALEHGLCNKIPYRDLDLQNVMTAYLDTIAWSEEVRKQLQAA